jgi:hypothetical protein
MFPHYSPPGSQKAAPAGPSKGGLEITPELVRKIADLVYTVLKRDLAIERERSGASGAPWGRKTGREL